MGNHDTNEERDPINRGQFKDRRQDLVERRGCLHVAQEQDRDWQVDPYGRVDVLEPAMRVPADEDSPARVCPPLTRLERPGETHGLLHGKKSGERTCSMDHTGSAPKDRRAA